MCGMLASCRESEGKKFGFRKNLASLDEPEPPACEHVHASSRKFKSHTRVDTELEPDRSRVVQSLSTAKIGDKDNEYA